LRQLFGALAAFAIIIGGSVHRANSATAETVGAAQQTPVLIRPRARSAPQLTHLSSATNGQYAARYRRPQDAGDTDIERCTSKCPAAHSAASAASAAKPLYVGNGWVVTQCWYRESTAGVQHPPGDIFLGCDYVPTTSTYVGGEALTISQHVGAPNQESPQCEGAQLIVNDLFVPDRGPSAGQDVGVKDANAIWQGAKNVGSIYRAGTTIERIFKRILARGPAWPLHIARSGRK
jgi:hypothetical protein